MAVQFWGWGQCLSPVLYLRYPRLRVGNYSPSRHGATVWGRNRWDFSDDKACYSPSAISLST